ncbi:putative DNA-damage-inducible protein F [Actinocatenispora thailandica]|uniref:Putative DNA-damage-inducible protein F n=2 Tax=Actinocatenispora thailandica TaxID=227318 RepID=A0A7R7HX82_9ACTN|nr:MATE family efflux transporter [Actinocatenispora thailandica]BCJ34868.1 putative DNA-damage-inducible protein F [Actinocatenispora thailandica]
MTSTVRADLVGGRRIAALALPALVVLAAEPLYVLVDTAVVGHLGAVPLAGLALGGNILSAAAILGNFLAYGTTGRAARRYGAGDRAGAVAEGVQASWLALAGGLGFIVAAQLLAGPVSHLLAGGGTGGAAIAAGAERWLRIAAFGAPGILLALAGNGWMRGVQATRRPVVFVLAANLLSAVLGPVLVYPAGLGLVGSAIANVTAQTVSAVLFVAALLAERVDLRPRPALLRAQLSVGRDLVLRTLSMQLCFTSAAAVAARFGAAALGAHQIALQLWNFCSLLLDSVAVAAQSLIGADLGAGRPLQARLTARRIGIAGAVCGAGLAVLVGLGAPVLPGVFSADPAVHHQAMLAWPWFVGLLPLAGVVFALDGVLIGAGDVGFLRNLTLISTLAGFLPAIWLAYALRLGLGGVWAGLGVFIALRLVLAVGRTVRGGWAVPGSG